MSTLTTEAAVRAAVVAKARGELGKNFGVGGRTPYGVWYGPGWENAYFCALGWSSCWYQALGESNARSVINFQTHGGVAPRSRGFVWTVAIITQHRNRIVKMKDLKPGDAVMYRYDCGDDRQANEVNHVDLVEVNHPNLGYVDCIGFNVPKPGATTGDPSRGGGVYRRRTYYSRPDPATGRTNPWVVAGIQMPAASVASVIGSPWSRIQQHLTDLGLAELQGSGVVGPATMAGVKAYADTYGYTGSHTDHNALLGHLEATMSSILDRLARLEKHVGITSPVSPPVSKPTASPNFRVTAENGLNVRSGPGDSHGVVSALRKGDRWRPSLKDNKPVIENGWMRGRSDAMRDAGKGMGWVFANHLEPWEV